MKDGSQSEENDAVAFELAALGYPGFAHLRGGRKREPAEVILRALKVVNLEPRIVEGLSWVLLACADLDWEILVDQAVANDLQNKLGFLTNVARRLAERLGRVETASLLKERETILARSRLKNEGTLCHESITQVERKWLMLNRPKEAAYWRLLTDLSPEHLNHI